MQCETIIPNDEIDIDSICWISLLRTRAGIEEMLNPSLCEVDSRKDMDDTYQLHWGDGGKCK